LYEERQGKKRLCPSALVKQKPQVEVNSDCVIQLKDAPASYMHASMQRHAVLLAEQPSCINKSAPHTKLDDFSSTQGMY